MQHDLRHHVDAVLIENVDRSQIEPEVLGDGSGGIDLAYRTHDVGVKDCQIVVDFDAIAVMTDESNPPLHSTPTGASAGT